MPTFSRLKSFLSQKYLPYWIISLLLVAASIAQLLPAPIPISRSDEPVFFPSPTPVPSSSPVQFVQIIRQYPVDKSFPSIANSSSVISFTFNRALTNVQISGMAIKTDPPVHFQKVTNINRKSVYFRPLSAWKADTLYTVTLKSPDFPTLNFSFTPVLSVDENEVLSVPEILPKP